MNKVVTKLNNPYVIAVMVVLFLLSVVKSFSRR